MRYWKGPGRAGRGGAVGRVGRPRRPPALPRDTLRRTTAACKRLASIGAAAHELGVSAERVRRRLSLARAVAALPRVKPVRCRG
jgi:hypothetical protein